MSKFQIYLSGSILDCSDKEAFEWRQTVTKELKERFGEDINVIDPTIYDYRKKEDSLEIVDIDLFTLERCDLMLAYISKYSCGTSMEIFYFNQILGRPVVTIIDPHLSVSPWLRKFSTFLTEGQWEEAYKIIELFFNRWKELNG